MVVTKYKIVKEGTHVIFLCCFKSMDFKPNPDHVNIALQHGFTMEEIRGTADHIIIPIIDLIKEAYFWKGQKDKFLLLQSISDHYSLSQTNQDRKTQ